MKHMKEVDDPSKMMSREYKQKYTIPNYRIGIEQDEVVGDMDLDKAIFKYMFFGQLTTRKNPMKGLNKIPQQPLPKPGQDVRPPMPVGSNPKMREHILALSLSPHIVVDKLKRVM